MPTTVYTDGACIGNPGPGGWAWAVPDGPHASGAEPNSTNQRMELTAALAALRAIAGPLVVVSDSKYVVDCFTQRWYLSWEDKGWRNAKREPVANQDLWKPLVKLFHARGRELQFRWVKGHDADPMNDVVDRLAVEAATTQTGRSGRTPPTDLGSADQPGRQRSAVAGPGAPPGHRLVVFGHRPTDLGGYGDNPVAAGVRARLTEILRGLAAVHPDLVVLTGLGLGAEQIAAESAAAAGVPYVAVLAFPGQDTVWPPASRAAYQKLLDGATSTVVLSDQQPATKPAAGKAIGRRTDWMVGHANGALVVWNGREPGLGATVRALERRIPDDVWIVSPEA
jgi:ribonuclease HI